MGWMDELNNTGPDDWFEIQGYEAKELRDLILEKDAKIERLQGTIEHWKRLEREAATYVESVICMKSRHFTGEEPYVGWKGLGFALKQDYEDMDRMREALRNVPQTISVASDQIERLREALKRIADYEGGPVDLIWKDMRDIARSALQQKESE